MYADYCQTCLRLNVLKVLFSRFIVIIQLIECLSYFISCSKFWERALQLSARHAVRGLPYSCFQGPLDFTLKPLPRMLSTCVSPTDAIICLYPAQRARDFKESTEMKME